jgi:hypothetical protein
MRREIPNMRFLANIRRSPCEAFPFQRNRVIVLFAATGHKPLFRLAEVANRTAFGATVISPFVVGWLMVVYGLPGVIWPMIGLLVVQIIAVYFWGVEPTPRPLEGLDPKA